MVAPAGRPGEVKDCDEIRLQDAALSEIEDAADDLEKVLRSAHQHEEEEKVPSDPNPGQELIQVSERHPPQDTTVNSGSDSDACRHGLSIHLLGSRSHVIIRHA